MRINPSSVYKKFQTSGPKKESSKVDGKSQSLRSGGAKEGAVLKGRILDANQDKVMIRLENGETIEAKLTGGNTFSIGEEVSFLVKEAGSDQVLITPLIDAGVQSEEQLMAILSEAGLPKTEEHMDMLKAMIDKELPIDQESIKQMSKLMAKYSEAPVKSLVFLTSHNIPVNETTIEQLQLLETNEQPLMRSMASLVDDLSATMQEPSQIREEVTSLNKPVVGEASVKSESSLQMKQTALIEVISQDKEAVTLIKQLDEQIQVLTKVIDDAKPPLVEGQPIESDLESASKAVLTIRPQLNETPITQMVMTNDGQRLMADVETALYKAVEQGPLSEGQESVLKELPSIDKLTVGNLVALMEVDLLSNEQLRSTLSEIKDASTYQALAKGLLMSDLKVVENGDVASWFEDVQEKVQEILSASDEAIVSEDVAKGAMQVKSTVEFMNTLQQDYQFMQLPMFLNDQLLTSEFYVLNQQKGSKDQKESITALVRLDLLNLGHTDIYLKKVDKNVDVQFYMTDESQINVMQEQVFKLHQRLRDKGFNTLSATVQPLEKAFDVVKDFLDKEDKSTGKTRYSFDMRA